jgi:HlyD family secretion protein
MSSRSNHGGVALSREALDFVPGLLAIQESPPARLPRVTLYVAATLFALLLTWAIFGKLDIIASAEGRLVPQTYVKIVQPASAGIVQDILVHEGEVVKAGQVLLRMDAHEGVADETSLQNALAQHALRLRRIDAELSGQAMRRVPGDVDEMFQQVQAQYDSHRRSFQDDLAHSQDMLSKAQGDHQAGLAVLSKLNEVTPILKQEADAYADLGKDGYVPRSDQQDKQRRYLESQHDLLAQQATVKGLAAAEDQALKQRDLVVSKYRSELQNERVQTQDEYLKLEQEQAKQVHKNNLLELRAPQAGVVKDLATHTAGTVVNPGTVLLTIVPEDEPLMAEVMVKNDDVGFVTEQQTVKLKLAAYPFQKYGLMDGRVIRVGPDAISDEANANKSKAPDTSSGGQSPSEASGNLQYKALVALDKQVLEAQGEHLKLVPGMQVVAEINQGTRTVMDYLLSPVRATLHDSARER